MNHDRSTELQPTGVTPAGIPVYTFAGIEFVWVPSGEFLMGSNRFHNEEPPHKVVIPYGYYIGRYPVTNAQFALFQQIKIGSRRGSHPVVEVSWQKVQEYLQWLNERDRDNLLPDFTFCLPSEAEWEKAARGTDGRLSPWGNEFDRTWCNIGDRIGRTTSVDKYSPDGDSPYGAADMIGNVWEWTRSLLKSYPYRADDGREDPEAAGERVIRGGSWYSDWCFANAAKRSNDLDSPVCISHLLGFRLVYLPDEVVSAR